MRIIGIIYSHIFLGQLYLGWLVFITFVPLWKTSFRSKLWNFSAPVMVLTNIISQTQYIFPLILLLHFNVNFSTIPLSWLLKIIEALQKEASTIFWIFWKALCWCVSLKEFYSLLSFCCWTLRGFDRYELHYTNTILTLIIQNPQRKLNGMANRKVEPAVPSLAVLTYAREQRATVLSPRFLWLIFGSDFVTDQHLCLGIWKTSSCDSPCWENKRSQKTFLCPPSAPL